MTIAGTDRKLPKAVHKGQQGTNQVSVPSEHLKGGSDKVSAAASGVAVGAVAGFVVLPGLGSLIGSVLGGVAGILIGFAADSRHRNAEEDHSAA